MVLDDLVEFPYYIVLLKQDEVQGVRVTLKKRFPYYIVLLKLDEVTHAEFRIMKNGRGFHTT